MRLLDTVVLVAALNVKDRYHKKASRYLDKLEDDIFVPLSVMLELDLLMKARKYTDKERRDSWIELATRISSGKILVHTALTLARASELQREGMGYFDSLVTALAQELNSIVITTDSEIAKQVQTEF
jgi:predicted nucleic-acid-binding protein